MLVDIIKKTMKMPKQLKRMAEKMKRRRRPGKMVVCRNCACIGPDFNACIRCKKKIPKDAKVIDDPDTPKPRIIAKVSKENQVKSATKKNNR